MICKYNFNGRYCEKLSDDEWKQPCVEGPCDYYEPGLAKLNADFEAAFDKAEKEHDILPF